VRNVEKVTGNEELEGEIAGPLGDGGGKKTGKIKKRLGGEKKTNLVSYPSWEGKN